MTDNQYCCEYFKFSVIQMAFSKTSGIQTEGGSWKVHVYLDYKTGDKLYPTMFDKDGNPELYQYENRRPMLMKFCPFCGKKLLDV